MVAVIYFRYSSPTEIEVSARTDTQYYTSAFETMGLKQVDINALKLAMVGISFALFPSVHSHLQSFLFGPYRKGWHPVPTFNDAIER